MFQSPVKSEGPKLKIIVLGGFQSPVKSEGSKTFGGKSYKLRCFNPL